jgi:predicted PurR-regulated permease PerM
MTYIEPHKLKQTIALLAIILLGAFLIISLSGFISAFLGAIIFYILCVPLIRFFAEKHKMNRRLAVFLSMFLSFLLILIPVLSLSWLLVNKISEMLTGSKSIYMQIQNFNNLMNGRFGVNILTHDNLAKLEGIVAKAIPDILVSTLEIGVTILVMYLILYYLLATETDIEKHIVHFLPYENENGKLFTKELISQTYSNIIGAPLLAVIQGSLSTLGFWIFGLQDPIFWGVICGLFSFVPFGGTPFIWVPAGILQISSNSTWEGIGILIYGLIIISGMDYGFRLIIQKKLAKVHPLITFFGIILGVRWFGLPGFIFGPLLISYFLIMIKIYKNEYTQKIIIVSDTADTKKAI